MVWGRARSVIGLTNPSLNNEGFPLIKVFRHGKRILIEAEQALDYFTPPDYQIACTDSVDLCAKGDGLEFSSNIHFWPPTSQGATMSQSQPTPNFTKYTTGSPASKNTQPNSSRTGYGDIVVKVFSFSTAPKQTGDTLQQYLTRENLLSKDGLMATSNLQIGGQEAVQVIYGEAGVERRVDTYIIGDTNYFIRISFYNETEGITPIPVQNYPNYGVYDLMLSSLKFHTAARMN